VSLGTDPSSPLTSRPGSWQFATGTTAVLVNLPSATLAPNTANFDGSQGMYVSAGSDFYQDLGAVYEAGLEYELTMYMGRSTVTSSTGFMAIELRDPDTNAGMLNAW
jgi:hypothetical protein